MDGSEEAWSSRYIGELDRVFPPGHASKNQAGWEADGPN